MSHISPYSSLLPSEQTLQRLMQRVNISSQRALAEKANVSRWQVQQLRQGKIDTMRVVVLKQIAAALDYSLNELLQAFDSEQSLSNKIAEIDNNKHITRLQQEYTRLEQRLEKQHHSLRHQFQIESLQVLESWLTYWPTAAKAATDNDGFDAKKLLPLVKPMERLIESWGVSIIGTVGEQLSYDPQQHQLVKGIADAGDIVRVRHVGYRHGDNLLQRAKVMPLSL